MTVRVSATVETVQEMEARDLAASIRPQIKRVVPLVNSPDTVIADPEVPVNATETPEHSGVYVWTLLESDDVHADYRPMNYVLTVGGIDLWSGELTDDVTLWDLLVRSAIPTPSSPPDQMGWIAGSTRPAQGTPNVGFWDTTNGELSLWSNGSWVTVGPGGTGLTDAQIGDKAFSNPPADLTDDEKAAARSAIGAGTSSSSGGPAFDPSAIEGRLDALESAGYITRAQAETIAAAAAQGHLDTDQVNGLIDTAILNSIRDFARIVPGGIVTVPVENIAPDPRTGYILEAAGSSGAGRWVPKPTGSAGGEDATARAAAAQNAQDITALRAHVNSENDAQNDSIEQIDREIAEIRAEPEPPAVEVLQIDARPQVSTICCGTARRLRQSSSSRSIRSSRAATTAPPG